MQNSGGRSFQRCGEALQLENLKCVVTRVPERLRQVNDRAEQVVWMVCEDNWYVSVVMSCRLAIGL